MPRISEFFGIIVSRLYSDHNPPHFQARYGEHEAMIGIDPIGIGEGSLPKRVQSLVFEWAAIHRDELGENWEFARKQQPLRKIPPLE